MYVFGKNNNHLIKNNYKTTFSLPQKLKIITKPILKCACGHDFIICLTQDYKAYCYFQAAVHNIDFKKDVKIVDVQTGENLILFVTQQGELYATEFLAEKLANDCLKPKSVRLPLPISSPKDKIIKQVQIVDGNIFLKMSNNQLIHFKKNDWMETKSFSDPRLVIMSKNCDIVDIKSNKRNLYFLAKDGSLYFALENQLSSNFKRVEMKDKLKKISSNKSQLFGINESGQIIKIQLSNGRAKSQKLWKISTKFTDIKVGDENFYGITENEEAWVWGKNSHGELGLSDYEPRNCIYPLVSLENYYIKNFFIGENYCCCTVDDTKLRDPMKQKQRESVKSSFREIRSFSTQNHFIQCKDSLNQTEEFLMPIRYTQEESKSSFMDQNQSRNDTSGIKSKKTKEEKEGKKSSVFKKSLNNSKKPTDRGSFKSSSKNPTNLSKISSKMADESSYRKNLNKSLRSNSKSFTSNSKSYISNSKFTPKSVTEHKSLFKGQKDRSEIKNILGELDPHSSFDKSYKRETIVSYKDPTNKPYIKQIDSKSVHKQCRQDMQRKLREHEIGHKEKINALSEAFKMEKQRLKELVDFAENELQLKMEEIRDLYALLSEKNVTISDITQKIRLLQSAIEEHEKALTARDNQAEQFYLRQKDYQQHIQKLQSQVQKMMQVLNSNERNKESEIYKKEMLRLSAQVKSRVQDEKNYYQERITSMQSKFDEERNLYELEMRKLREQVEALGKERGDFGEKGNGKLDQKEFCINTYGLENNSSHCMESPTFNTLDMKHNLKRKISEGYLLNQSQITLQDKVNENQRHPLQQSNRLYQTMTPLQKRYQQDLVTRKNSRTKSFSSKLQFQNDENKFDEKSQTQVKDILSKIQINKSFISKSANKLFNILENQKD